MMVATEDADQNSLTIKINSEATKMRLNFAKDVKLVGDIDLLTYLRFKRRRDGLPTEMVKILEEPIV